MTELQMGLIGLGTVAVFAVLAYNKWQESRHRKIAERMMATRHADVLMDPALSHEVADAPRWEEDAPDLPMSVPVARAASERFEPMLRTDPQFDEAGVEAALEISAAEPNSFGAEKPVRASVAASPLAKHEAFAVFSSDEGLETKNADDGKECGFPFHWLSPLIDYVASFEAIEAASAAQILETQRDFLVRVRKPVHWVGYNEQRHEWEAIAESGESGQSEYRRFCVGLQLVDRNGPASEGDLSVFHLAMQDLAEDLMAVVDLPPRQYVLETAAQLDRFSAGVDIQIGLNVISQSQPFAGTKLRALAEAAGMTFDHEGYFVRRDDEGHVLYRLANQAEPGFAADSIKTISTHGITFLLDVPRVAHGDRAFNQMLDLARRFAEALQGSLVDDNRRPLAEGSLEPIRRQLVEYQAEMASRNLPAGGHLALRLFS